MYINIVWARLSTHQNVGQNVNSIVGTCSIRNFANGPFGVTKIGLCTLEQSSKFIKIVYILNCEL